MELCFFHTRGHNPEAKFQQREQAGISPCKALQTIEQYQEYPKNSSKKEVSGDRKNQTTIPPLPYKVI